MCFNYLTAAPRLFGVLLEEQAMKVRSLGKASKKLSAANLTLNLRNMSIRKSRF